MELANSTVNFVQTFEESVYIGAAEYLDLNIASMIHWVYEFRIA
jgi:hypothetical protein